MTIEFKIGSAIGVAILIAVGAYIYLFSKGRVLDRATSHFLNVDSVDNNLVAETDVGKVLGYRHKKGVLRYSRIPFAAPPVDDLRFRPPQAVSPWLKVLDARSVGPSCIQRITPDNEASQRDQSEDCLSLSVTTPHLDEAKRPVIVWIHGGGLAVGGNSDPTHDGANFAAHGDVVFVNLQYRLGALGWLDVSSLGGDHDDVQDSRLNGQLDLLAGLEWVQRNIAQFGGDPNNITLMGESAGASLVASLLLMSEAQSLFDKAILQSGVHEVWEIPVDRHGLLQLVLDQAKVDSLEDLRRIKAQTMQKIEQAIHQLAQSQGLPGPMPWYDSRGITSESFAGAALSGKPVLHGTLKDEYHLFLLSYQGSEPHRQMADGFLGGLGLDRNQIDRLVTQLSKSLPDRSENDLLVDLATVIYMHYPHVLFSETYSVNAPVYHYLIDWTSPNFPELGAMHALDLPLVFGNFDTWTWALGDNPPQALSDDMQAAWIAFARTGNPSHGSIPPWPAYDQATRAVMRFGDAYEVLNDPLGWVRNLGSIIDEMVQESGD